MSGNRQRKGSVRNQVFERIEKLPEGTLVTIKDFTDLADRIIVRQYIQQLCVGEKKLIRICDGIYQKPKYSELLQEYVLPSADQVVEALARKNGWKIAHGATIILNELGLSTQVPAKNVYIYGERWRNLKIGNYELHFRRDEKICYFSSDVFPIVVAVSELGRRYLGDREIRILSKRLTEEQKKRLLDELNALPDDLYFPDCHKEAIRRICTLEEGASTTHPHKGGGLVTAQ